MSVRVTDAEVERLKQSASGALRFISHRDVILVYRVARDLLEAREALRQIGGPTAEAALEGTK